MRAAADADDYRADPAGAYLVGGEHLVFCARPTLWGFALWGRPGADALARLVGLLALELRAPTVPHASLADLRRVDAVDPAAFAAIGGYVEAHFAALARQVATPVIASGGVAGIADLEALKAVEDSGIDGVICGRALYDGKIVPKQALALLDS